MDPAKSLKKQIKTFPPYFFYFRVKFYVPNPDCLAEEYTRYYFFLQLNKDILSGRLKAPPQEMVTLTGLAVQSELGDHNPEEQGTDYLFGATFMPDQTEEFMRKVSTVHRRLKGLRPTVCERKYLAIVKNFDGYGVNLYKAALEQTNEEIQLGVTSQGLVMFKNDVKINTFAWAKIVKLSFKRKFFFIHLHKESPTDDTVENVYGFHMACYRTCKNLWKSCVEHHTFFCLHGQTSSSLSSSSRQQDLIKQSSGDSFQMTSKDQSFKPLSSSLHRDSPRFDSPSSHLIGPQSSASSSPSQGFGPSCSIPLLQSGTKQTSSTALPQEQQQFLTSATTRSAVHHQQQTSEGKKSLARSAAFRSSPVMEQSATAYHPKSAFNSPSDPPLEGIAGKIKPVEAVSSSSSSFPSSPILSSLLHNGSTKVSQGTSTCDSKQQLNNNTSNFANLYDNEDRLNDCSHNSYKKSSSPSLPKNGTRFVGVHLREGPTPGNRDIRGTASVVRHYPTGERRRTFESRPISHRPDDELSEEEEGQIVEKSTANMITTLSPVVLVTSNDNCKFADDKFIIKEGQKIPRNSSSNCLDGLKTVRMKPDAQGRFGFNVKGGADQMQPIIVSRVAPDSSADQCIPKLCEGDHVLFINGRDVSQHTHAQVVQFIRASREIHSGELVLVVRPMVYSNSDLSPGEPDFQYIPDTHHIVALLNPGEDKLAASITQLKESIESKAGILQFEQLYRKRAEMSMSVSQMPSNLARNRYRDISPYDLTRVKLLSTSHDYINATFVNMKIPGTNLTNHYIATQGPLPGTTSDFWTMVYEQGCTLVVMLTVLEERGHVKCHKYWPDLGTTMTFKDLDFSLTCLSESSPCPSFVCRYLVLTVGPEMQEHHVHQVQYVAWPDHGVPDDCTDFLDFIQLVRQTKKGSTEPMVVHCSAGIGRTGVLIAMETAICTIEADQPVHMLEIVKQMRDQRAMLIQTSSQYKFVCEAVIKVYDEKIIVPMKEFAC